ncbi:MAG: cell division protein FtsZ [Bacteroidia bacterium]|nr:cell division protein FtsZ [Bacteroidia bacterium]
MQAFDLDSFEPIARIVVIGVGGAGNNAVNRMIDEDLGAVEFYVANTDRQTLSTSKTRNRIVLGPSVTGGLGAGGEPSVGREAAMASVEDIRKVVKGANMVFIAAGMGGGTGTGAAPVVAQVAREEGALTVAIVTRPFTFEGKKRIANSVEGLNELKDAVDAIIIVSNDKLLMVSGTQPISEAFAESDRVLAQSVKTVTDLILMPAVINLDFADVRNTLKESGISLIGFGLGQGPNRAQEAAQNAINSPLLEASINGARRAICSVTCGPNVSLYEAQEAVDLVIEAAGNNIDVKFGVAINNQLTDQILVSVIASDFTEEFDFTSVPTYNNQLKPQRNDADKANGLSNGKAVKEEKPEEKDASENANEDSILPSFLKSKHIE